MAETRYPVLQSRIPAKPFGREITEEERNGLASLGVSVPVHARVVRAFDSDYIGALYKPYPGGLSAIGISVTTRA